MDRDTNLFVQAFWVKCRETIRPELDRLIGRLAADGHTASISTQEYSNVADGLPEPGPVMTLHLHSAGSPHDHTLQFRGDTMTNSVEVTPAGGRPRRYELAALDEESVRRDIDDWLAAVPGRRS
ncbi:MAG: hypothetical protein ACOY4R_30730 [Pseudomonadota bacterium]